MQHALIFALIFGIAFVYAYLEVITRGRDFRLTPVFVLSSNRHSNKNFSSVGWA